ncbi:MAG: High potential iron-sulfur protein [Proteobacteria bacterium]|nr:MAG: High potential iron-sulfur protein [Pseudomonadota bacterium]
MSDSLYDRRTLLKNALAGLAALPAAGLIREVHGAELPHLDPKDPQAVAMSYTHDASTVDPKKEPTFKPGAHCANCLHIQGQDGEEWRGCNIFPGKLVHADGWCKVWVAKPG